MNILYKIIYTNRNFDSFENFDSWNIVHTLRIALLYITPIDETYVHNVINNLMSRYCFPISKLFNRTEYYTLFNSANVSWSLTLLE